MNAREATLLVEGLTTKRRIPTSQTGLHFETPQPTSPETENVYTLTLSLRRNGPYAKLWLIRVFRLTPRDDALLAPSTAKVWTK